MPLVVRAFPILPGKEEQLREFAAEMAGARRSEASAFYRSFGVTRESWHLQQTEQGAINPDIEPLGPPTHTLFEWSDV